MPIKGRALVLKMHTDEGLVGFGELTTSTGVWSLRPCRTCRNTWSGRNARRPPDHRRAQLLRSIVTRPVGFLRVITSRRGGVDLAPTLLDLCGLSFGNPIDGRSVASALTSGEQPEAIPVFSDVATSDGINDRSTAPGRPRCPCDGPGRSLEVQLEPHRHRRALRHGVGP